MPARYFAPKEGFADKSVAAIKVETVDGYATSAEIMTDGTERPLGSVNHLRQSVPTWTETELARLAAGGTWKELDGPPQADAAPHDEPAAAQTAEPEPRDEPETI